MGCQRASRNDDRPATIETSVRANQTISGYPHTIDYYIPDNAESAVIFLHGGGGKKERFAANLEIKLFPLAGLATNSRIYIKMIREFVAI